MLEWVAISSFRASSQPRDWTRVSCIGRRIPYHQHHLSSYLYRNNLQGGSVPYVSREARATVPRTCVCVCVCVCVRGCSAAQSYLTLCNTMDYSLPGSSVHRVLGVGCHFFLQGNILIQGSNPRLLHLLHQQVDSLPLITWKPLPSTRWVLNIHNRSLYPHPLRSVQFSCLARGSHLGQECPLFSANAPTLCWELLFPPKPCSAQAGRVVGVNA